MQRVRLSDAVELSRIVYGMWRLGDDADTSADHIQAKVEACLDQGITTIDQADIYGGYQAEELFGACLKAAPGLRDRLEIVTKCDIVAPVGRHGSARVKHYDTSSRHISASIDSSLKLMGIDHIDLLLIHRPDPLMDAAETGAALDAAVAAGKVRAVGVSNFKPHDWTLLQSHMTTPLITNQIEISLQAHEPFTNGDIAFAQERKIAPMAWSPLGGGALVAGAADTELLKALDGVARKNGTDRAAVAIAWLLAHPARILPVMGTNNLDRICTFADAFSVEMDRETWFELYTAALGHEVP
ncbi:MAG: aldo/keto reductase [Rhodobacter sp.]|nr:aldo/keto reductase [Rhodobacter sp.]